MTDTVNVSVDEVLDAVADYLVEQYGKSFGLNHHLDRDRIKATIQPEAPKVEQEPVANPLVFGLGALVVDHGKYGGEPAVFVAKAKAAGRVGELTGRDYFDRESLQPGELVLQFPTDAQAKSVADALVGSPAPSSDELIEDFERKIEWAVAEWENHDLSEHGLVERIKDAIVQHKGPKS